MFSQIYNHQTALRENRMAEADRELDKVDKPVYAKRWEPNKYRYVRNQRGTLDAFSGYNRQERRANAAGYRHCFRDMTTGQIVKGTRSRRKAELRKVGRK